MSQVVGFPVIVLIFYKETLCYWLSLTCHSVPGSYCFQSSWVSILNRWVSPRGSQRDVVYSGWPIAPSYMSPKAGGGRYGVSANECSCAHEAQINFGDLIPITYISRDGQWVRGSFLWPEVKYRVRSPKFIWVRYAQQYSLAETLNPSPHPHIPPHLGSYTRALFRPR